jgi:hypothetical protein
MRYTERFSSYFIYSGLSLHVLRRLGVVMIMVNNINIYKSVWMFNI